MKKNLSVFLTLGLALSQSATAMAGDFYSAPNKTEGLQSIKMESVYLRVETDKSKTSVNTVLAGSATAVGAPIVTGEWVWTAELSKRTNNVLSAMTVVGSLFASFSYVAKGGVATSSKDSVKEIRKSAGYKALEKSLGHDTAEDVILALYSGADPAEVIKKYVKDESVKKDLLAELKSINEAREAQKASTQVSLQNASASAE